MTDVKIVVDTSSDIPADIAEKYDIGILSFLSIFGENGTSFLLKENCC